jgi:hypothetical protein
MYRRTRSNTSQGWLSADTLCFNHPSRDVNSYSLLFAKRI